MRNRLLHFITKFVDVKMRKKDENNFSSFFFDKYASVTEVRTPTVLPNRMRAVIYYKRFNPFNIEFMLLFQFWNRTCLVTRVKACQESGIFRSSRRNGRIIWAVRSYCFFPEHIFRSWPGRSSLLLSCTGNKSLNIGNK